MKVTATQKYVRITPRKLREVADLVRGRSLPEVNDILSTLNRRGARVLNETIRQAVANAVNNLGHNEQQLVLQTVMVNEGPRYKRFRAGSRGRAKPYVKRSSHIRVELEILNPAKSEKAVKTEKTEVATETVTEAKKAPAKKTATKKPAAKKPAVKAKKEE